MDVLYAFFFFFKQKTAYEMRISDWSSGVCSSDLDRKLDRALEADVGVDAVVVDAGQHQMLLVDGAAEPFDAVVRAVVDLAIVDCRAGADARQNDRSEEHTSELQSLMRISYAVFCLKKTQLTSLTTHQP